MHLRVRKGEFRLALPMDAIVTLAGKSDNAGHGYAAFTG
jgi:hypothetical protein